MSDDTSDRDELHRIMMDTAARLEREALAEDPEGDGDDEGDE